MSRTPFVPAELLSKLWRAVIEFDMLQAGDRILIGLSGGKDSMFLTAALAEIQKYAPVPFELACYTVDAMFSPAFPKADLAHHHDDAVETFLMNVLTSGQLRTFLPITPLSRTGLTVLRPLLYYREAEIIDMVRQLDLQPLRNPCPYDGHTKRQDIKEHIRELEKLSPEVYDHLAAAMRNAPNQELWPEQLSQKQLADKFHNFWRQKSN